MLPESARRLSRPGEERQRVIYTVSTCPFYTYATTTKNKAPCGTASLHPTRLWCTANPNSTCSQANYNSIKTSYPSYHVLRRRQKHGLNRGR